MTRQPATLSSLSRQTTGIDKQPESALQLQRLYDSLSLPDLIARYPGHRGVAVIDREHGSEIELGSDDRADRLQPAILPPPRGRSRPTFRRYSSVDVGLGAEPVSLGAPAWHCTPGFTVAAH